MSSGVRLGLAIGAVSAAAVFAGLEAAAQAKEQDKRDAAILNVVDQFKANYPRELANRLISAFSRSGYSGAFEPDPVINKFYEAKLFQFCLLISEDFADMVINKRAKFTKFEVEMSVRQLFDRSIRDFGYKNKSSDQLEAEWLQFLDSSDDTYRASIGDPTKIAKLDKKIEKSTFFNVTNGYALILHDEYRCIQINHNGSVEIFENLSIRDKAYSNDKVWKEIQDINKKKKFIDNNIHEIRAAALKK